MAHFTNTPHIAACGLARLRSGVLGCIIACFALLATPVEAANTSAAEVLFQAGRAAMRRHAYDEACLKFKESNQIDQAPGTVMNLANCEQKRGNVATAWEYFTEAMELLDKTDRRYAVAKERAERLEASVPRLVVTLASDAPSTSLVLRDGKPLGALLGLPARVDPGEHTVSVEAPGHEPSHYQVRLELGDTQRLEVRPGAQTGAAAVPGPSPPQATPEPTLAVTQEHPHTAASEPGTWRWVLAGTSIGTLAAAGVFGALSYQEWTTVRTHCDLDVDPHQCDQAGLSAQSRGRDFGVTAFALGGVGLLAGGAFLIVSSQADTEVTVAADVTREYSGLTVRGAF